MKDCPHCREGMQELAAAGVTVDRCRRCGGVWLDRGELQQLARCGPEALASMDGAAARPAGTPAGGSCCPQCGKALVRVAHKQAPELHMAGCQSCGGLWLPHGQLSVLARHLPGARTGAGLAPGVRPGANLAPAAEVEPLPGRAPRSRGERGPLGRDRPVPVGRVFRRSAGGQALRASLGALVLGVVIGIVGAALWHSHYARFAVPVWAGGGGLLLLYVLGSTFLAAGESIVVQREGLLKRTLFGSARAPFASIVRLQTAGGGPDASEPHGGYWGSGDLTADLAFAVVGAVVAGMVAGASQGSVQFEVVTTEGDWRSNITFGQDWEDWEELVGIVTAAAEERNSPR